MQVVFRTDASEALGAGHLVRCLVLADAIADGGGVSCFLVRDRNSVSERVLNNCKHEVQYLDLPETCSIQADVNESAKRISSRVDWLVTDHYELDIRWEKVMRAHAKRLLAIDDLADRSHDCDLLVDPGLGRKKQDYESLVPRHTQLLLGTDYAILNSLFLKQHDSAPMWPAIRRVHVFFGGGSASWWLPEHIQAILDVDPTLEVSAVGHADEQTMDNLAALYGARLQWCRYVQNMASHFSQCDVAIGSPGTATWERACVGLPSGLVATAKNQIPLLKALEKQGFCRFLGLAWDFDSTSFAARVNEFLGNSSALAAMRSLGVAAVDGGGGKRIVRQMFIAGGNNV